MYELDKYVELIKKGEYFDAHEVLEEIWQDLRKTDNEIQWAYKGLINAAVALELKKRKRPEYVYKKVWGNFEKYKKFYKLNEKILKTSYFVEKYKI
jgi:predicted metal-dependent hydrolase